MKRGWRQDNIVLRVLHRPRIRKEQAGWLVLAPAIVLGVVAPRASEQDLPLGEFHQGEKDTGVMVGRKRRRHNIGHEIAQVNGQLEHLKCFGWDVKRHGEPGKIPSRQPLRPYFEGPGYQALQKLIPRIS